MGRSIWPNGTQEVYSPSDRTMSSTKTWQISLICMSHSRNLRDVFGEPIVRVSVAKREHDPFLKQYMDILAEIFRGDARNVDLLEVTDALEGKQM